MLEFGVPEPFDDGKDEGHGLSASCSVSGEDVLAFVDVPEGLLLDGVQTFDAFFLE